MVTKTKGFATVAQVDVTDANNVTTPTSQPPISYEAYGKIHCDIFNINKYMLNNIDIKLVFSKSSDNFVF